MTSSRRTQSSVIDMMVSELRHIARERMRSDRGAGRGARGARRVELATGDRQRRLPGAGGSLYVIIAGQRLRVVRMAWSVLAQDNVASADVN